MISKKAVKTLLDLYLGEHVILYLKGMNVVLPNADGGAVDITAMIQGIVMDIDDTFMHLGDGNMTSKSIGHENIGLIEANTLMDETMMGMDFPTNDTEIN